MNQTPAAWPDYQNCIANLPNSILRYFGVPEAGAPLPCLDKHLNKEYRNVVLILLDGLGVGILEANLKRGGFFRTHLAETYSSVFPPTTVAATTSVLSGQPPCSHAWLGWDCYYPQIGQNVTVYPNVLQDTDVPAADYSVAERFTPYENIFTRFEKAGKDARLAAPFAPPFPDSFEALAEMIRAMCAEDGRKYIYAYWIQPDEIMHQTGCFSRESKETLRTLERQIRALCAQLEDSLVIVTADHGHRNTRSVCLSDYPTLTECLVRMPSFEPRALNLFVKPEKAAQFETEFLRLFGKDYLLMTKQEVLDRKLFGPGQEHACFRDMLGDYLAAAVGDLSIFTTKEKAAAFIGVHAGLTEEELTIPLILIDSKEEKI